MLGKNLVLERPENLKTNQNTGFFKLQYLTNKLGYEVEYGNITRGLKCNKYYLAVSSRYSRTCLGMPKVITNSLQSLSQEEVEL